ncbi:ATP-binding protein [Yinghuangia seranimata]|uniref:ATP-binding protein n=1 Tax=Yinghuangia seranimata TaxID=408067 RepID=UPI00248CACD9|nr:ATP-binding protein [Yinghuangia seranimata]MDI2130882.1 ATP-binding protein [Yinghuangia seranimata]
MSSFHQSLSATPRGARLARLLATEQLRAWSLSGLFVERAECVVAELASNAVLHGEEAKHDFRLALGYDAGSGVLRIEVADGHAAPLLTGPDAPCPNAESGRGLLIVAALSDRWGVRIAGAVGKTVWAELVL